MSSCIVIALFRTDIFHADVFESGRVGAPLDVHMEEDPGT